MIYIFSNYCENSNKNLDLNYFLKNIYKKEDKCIFLNKAIPYFNNLTLFSNTNNYWYLIESLKNFYYLKIINNKLNINYVFFNQNQKNILIRLKIKKIQKIIYWKTTIASIVYLMQNNFLIENILKFLNINKRYILLDQHNKSVFKYNHKQFSTGFWSYFLFYYLFNDEITLVNFYQTITKSKKYLQKFSYQHDMSLESLVLKKNNARKIFINV